MKVFLGGTVNGSKWRNSVKNELIVDYFDPVVDDWNDAAYERELSERRNCDFLLYVLTPKMTGYYAVAEVTDDAFTRPDRTLYCYLPKDGEDEFTKEQIEEFEYLGEKVVANGGKWLKDLHEVVSFLNSSIQVDNEMDESHHDAFISYGRRESQDFVNRLSNRLSDLKLDVFYDVGEIPIIIENEEYIYRKILRSDNFIYIISPNSVRSEFCKKELEFAIKFKKRIIPVVHEALNNEKEKLDEIIAGKELLTYDFSDADLSEISDQIIEFVKQDKDYITQHSELLFKAREWDMKGRRDADLLFGKQRKSAIKWLNEKSKVSLPLELHVEFIEASKKLSSFMSPLLWLEEKTRTFTKSKSFDKVALVISLGNPFALALQIKDLFPISDIPENFPIEMWFLFLMINITLTFVAIKTKNLSLFISMLLSVMVVISVISIVLFGR